MIEGLGERMRPRNGDIDFDSLLFALNMKLN
jgi:hypothetical protein